MLPEICKLKETVLAHGGFNYKNLDGDGVVCDLESEDFLQVVHDGFLKQVVTEPTRGT